MPLHLVNQHVETQTRYVIRQSILCKHHFHVPAHLFLHRYVHVKPSPARSSCTLGYFHTKTRLPALITYQLGVVAFAYAQNDQETVKSIFDMNHWANMALPILETLIIWIGDALMVGSPP